MSRSPSAADPMDRITQRTGNERACSTRMIVSRNRSCVDCQADAIRFEYIERAFIDATIACERRVCFLPDVAAHGASTTRMNELRSARSAPIHVTAAPPAEHRDSPCFARARHWTRNARMSPRGATDSIQFAALATDDAFDCIEAAAPQTCDHRDYDVTTMQPRSTHDDANTTITGARTSASAKQTSGSEPEALGAPREG